MAICAFFAGWALTACRNKNGVLVKPVTNCLRRYFVMIDSPFLLVGQRIAVVE